MEKTQSVYYFLVNILLLNTNSSLSLPTGFIYWLKSRKKVSLWNKVTENAWENVSVYWNTITNTIGLYYHFLKVLFFYLFEYILSSVHLSGMSLEAGNTSLAPTAPSQTIPQAV